MRMIASEYLIVMSEPSSNFAYAAATVSRTNARGNTNAGEIFQPAIDDRSYQYRVL